MNKTIKTILIISVIVFGVGFLLINSAQAGVVQFGDKDIFVDFDELPFNLSNWAPGMSSSPKTIAITNNEDFDINLYFKAKKTLGDGDLDGDLADVLTITIDAEPNHLSDLFNNNIALTPVNSGESQNYNIAISFDEDAGNEYQGKSINFDFIITAEEEEVIIPGARIPITPTTPVTDTGEVTATPGEGGITTLTNPDGSKIKLTIPPEAVSENTNFTINPVDISSVSHPEPASGLFLIAGLVYEIKAEVNGEFITTFDKPITLTFTYTDEQIEALDETSLKIYYWDGENWIALENSEVNTDNNTVTASIDHFTLFALLGSKIEFIEEEFEKEEEMPSEEEILVPTGEEEEEIEKPLEEGMEREEKVVGPEEVTPSEEEMFKRDLASMLTASLTSSWGDFREGKFFDNLIFWTLIAFFGLFLWSLSVIKKARVIFGVLGFIGTLAVSVSTLLLPLPIIEQLRISLPNFISYPVGLLLFVGGIFIVFLASKALSLKVAFNVTKPGTLITSGLYKIVRHPLYLGLVTAYFGWCITFKAVLALLFIPVLFFFLFVLTIFEEKDLLKTYGDTYTQYTKRVLWRIIPKIL